MVVIFRELCDGLERDENYGKSPRKPLWVSHAKDKAFRPK